MKMIRYGSLLSVTLFVLALLVAPLTASPALAQCVEAGTNVNCTGTDANGYQDATTNTGVTLTVEFGATVSNTTDDALRVGSNSTVVNNGTVQATGDNNEGVYAYRGSTVVNNGTITTDGYYGEAIYTVGTGSTVTNNGTLVTNNWDSDGIGSQGNSNTVVNNGTINTAGTHGNGIFQTGLAGTTSTVTNNGTIDSNWTGISIYRGDTVINNTGTILATSNGIETSVVSSDTGADVVNNTGTIIASGAAITTGGGTDTILVNGAVTGDVNAGTGDDAVTIGPSNPAINGMLNGGSGTDSLTFALTVTAADAPALAATIAAASPAGGSLTYGGNVYEWTNFETLVNLLNVIASSGGGGGGGGGPVVVLITTHSLADGRLNPLDLAATAIPYCGLGGNGLDIYAVVGSQIELAFQVNVDEMRVGLAAASGAPVQIAPQLARLGVALYALDGNTLQANGPEGYSFVFQANVCGLG